jgi:hypothetical protein
MGARLFLRILSQTILEDFTILAYLKHTHETVLEVPIHRDDVYRWPVGKVCSCLNDGKMCCINEKGLWLSDSIYKKCVTISWRTAS